MYDIGVIVCSWNIPIEVQKRFYRSIVDSNPHCSYKVLHMDETNSECFVIQEGKKIFCRTKALNAGIHILKNECRVIVCTDVDMLVPPGLIDFTFKSALNMNVNIWVRCRNIDEDRIEDKNWDEWLKIPLREAGKGSWNAMTVETWFKSGGWHEAMFGWGHEDDEFSKRRAEKGIKDIPVEYFALMHVNHPPRTLRRGWENHLLEEQYKDVNWLEQGNKMNNDSGRYKERQFPKQTVLTLADRAMGHGDGFILLPTLIDLSKQYNVRHVASAPSYQILKLFQNPPNLNIFNLDSQGQFYQNDHVRSINLTYWDVVNTLRGYGQHAINLTRAIAGLSTYDGILPDIPIPEDVDAQMKSFVGALKKPVIVTHTFMSYWNKMVDPNKQVKIVDELTKLGGTVIQIGANIPEHMISGLSMNFVGKTSIEQSIALVKNADLFVGYDSFLQHCAAFVRTPAVVMFLGTSPEEFGYNFQKNIAHHDISFCQRKCARPMRFN